MTSCRSVLQRALIVLLAGQGIGCAARQHEYLFATGLVRLSNDSLETYRFRKLRQRSVNQDQPAKGSYSLELQDRSAAVLARREFELMRHSFRHELGAFTAIIPYHASTAKIVLRHQERVLASIGVTPNAPVVRLTYPARIETIRGRQTITWTASDPDGDSLRYDVLYSANGGNSWTALAVNLAIPRYEWDSDNFGGSDHALIRVLSSDGVNTGEGQSPREFRVIKKSPQVIIFSPRKGMAFFHGGPVVLEGWGLDLEDGSLNDRALSWLSDVQGLLGNGNEIEVDSLRAGTHVITLQGRDKDGNIGSAMETVTVLPALDRDSDNLGDADDNCPLVHNPEQTDANKNKVGDACDDTDHDGYVDNDDTCRHMPDDQADKDGDGIGDACEGDLDTDADVDADDAKLLLEELGKAVRDSKCGRACDLDGDEVITVRDTERLRLLCTRPGCARL